MKKTSHINNLTYTFDGTRKGAKYTLNGTTWMNHGEYAECLAKSVLGYKAEKDANTRFDKGEDIAELNASVKSQNCGLTDMKLGNNREEFLQKFWEMTNEDVQYIWVYDHDEMVDLYYMNLEEFKRFTERFGSWDGYCKKIRFKTCSSKVIAWLEENL